MTDRAFGILLTVSLLLFACASSSPLLPPQPGTPLAQIRQGMDERQVLDVLGPPTSTRSYMTGKFWNPFYFGPDQSRVEWTYAGVGRVVFSQNFYTGRLKVVEVSRE